MKNLLVILTLLLAGFSASCVSTDTVASDRIKSNDIFQGYSISGSKKETALNAFFRVGGSSGTTVELIAPSKIKYNGELLTKSEPNILKGTSYVTSKSGYQPRHEILFTNSEGKDSRINLTLEAIEFMPKSQVVLKRSKTNLLSLNRLPTDSDEKIEITLSNESFQTQEKNKVTVDVPLTFDRAKNTLIISPNLLKKFPNGTANLIMTSSKSLSLEQLAEGGGNFSVNYEAAHLRVQIVN